MRVLFITPFYEPAWRLGGMAKSTAAWASSLAAEGHDCCVFTTIANGASDLELLPGTTVMRDGVEVTYLSRMIKSGNRYFSGEMLQRCLMAAPAFDLVHSAGLWTYPGLAAWITARSRQMPLVVSLHGTLMQQSYNHHGASKRIASFLIERRRVTGANRVVCTSQVERKHYLRWSQCDNSAIVPLVVRAPKIDRAQMRQEYRVQNQLGAAKVFVFAGRLVANKGIELTVAAFNELAAVEPDAFLLIIGPEQDDTATEVRQMVKRFGLETKVRILGLLSGTEYWRAIAAADCVILNSLSENFGLAVAEASALGIPVVISDQVGIAPYVAQYSAGLIAPLTVPEIAQAMLQMTRFDESVWSEMSLHAQEMVEREFTAHAVAKQLQAVFVSTLRDK